MSRTKELKYTEKWADGIEIDLAGGYRIENWLQSVALL